MKKRISLGLHIVQFTLNNKGLTTNYVIHCIVVSCLAIKCYHNLLEYLGTPIVYGCSGL